MKRSPMPRGSGFKRPELPPRVPPVIKPISQEIQCRITDGRGRLSVLAPKYVPLRSQPYLRWVASLPCKHCQRAGLSQASHGDEGKGMGTKAGDETAKPLCADSPGRRGCHSIFGQSGLMPRAIKRQLEDRYAAETRREAWETGNWPAGWPAPVEATTEVEV